MANTKDVKKEMDTLKKDAKLQPGEKVINVYSKVQMKSLGGEGNPIPKDKVFHVHPEHVPHLVEKKFAVKHGDETTDVPNFDDTKKDDNITVV